jgi:hypothetical protein
MRDDRKEKNYSFCYWDIEAECLSLDQQTFLPSPENRFSDLKIEAGYLNWEEYRGAERRTFLSSGVNNPGNRGRIDSQSFVSGTSIESDEDETIWPCTASVILNIPPPPETLVFRDRERHGVQLRLISMNPAPCGMTRSLMNGRLGVTSVDAPWSITKQIGKVIRELTKSITAKQLADPTITATRQPAAEAQKTDPKFLTAYSLQVDNLVCKMEPKFDTKMPLTRISGERSSESSFFAQVIADKFMFAWGQQAASITKGLSLHQVAALPENVRMRILLCLDDIQPLEEALYLKKEANPFKRCRNVNKGIAKRAKKMAKSSKAASKHKPLREASSMNRRQQILREMMKFDDSDLDELWALHQKHKRKLAKERAKKRQAVEAGEPNFL